MVQIPKMTVRFVVGSLALWFSALPAATTAIADEVQVFTSGAAAAVLRRLAPAFPAASGHDVKITAATLKEMLKIVSGGAKPDVVVAPRLALQSIDKAGALRPGSMIDLAQVGIGITVRDGAPLPDISTEDALRRTLLNAKSIVHPDPAGGGFASRPIVRMIDRLGIAEAVKPKVKLMFAFAGGVEAVVKGDVEIGIFNMSEIVSVPGARLVGPLPPPFQSYLVFAGALYAHGASPEAAEAYLRSLVSPEARSAWMAGGFETMSGVK